MANNTFGKGLKYILGAREATADTAESLTASNVLHFHMWKSAYKILSLKNNSASPEGPGFKPVAGMKYFDFEFERNIVSQTVAAGDTTDVPACDVQLHMSGWQRTGDNASNQQVYLLKTYVNQAATLEAYWTNNANDDQIKHKLVGARAVSKISFRAGEYFRLAGKGKAKGATDVDSVVVETGSGAATLVYGDEAPVVAIGGTIKLYRLSDGAVFGGGSLASPTQGLAVVAFDFDPGMGGEPLMQKSANAAGGLQRSALLRSDVATIELTVEVTDLDEFNPLEALEDSAPYGVEILFSSGSNRVLFYANAVITSADLDEGGEGASALWTLSMDCVYFQDAADNSPAAGLSPSQAPKTGSNKGLPANPATALTPSVAALSFYTV